MTLRLKHIASISKGRATTADANKSETGVPLISMSALRSKAELSWVESGVPDCFEGDIVVCWDGSNSGEFFISNHTGMLASTIGLVKTSPKVDKSFVFYLLKSYEQHLRANIVGMGIPHVNPFELKNISVPKVDLPTQKWIAAFLDRETARIDELIAKKVAFAELILAREEASFLAAVTGKTVSGRKLNSGVDWIGELPEGWLAPKFTMVAGQETGHTPSRKDPSYWVPEDCVIPWISLADVWQLRSGEKVYIDDTSEKISAFGMANSSARLLPKDTVVLSRTASVGFVAIMGCPMATTQDFAAWICGPTIRPKFLYYVLRAMKPEFRRLMMGSTHQTIYMPDIRSFRTPVPPLDEQDRIIRTLDASIGTYRQVHGKIAASVEKLREYRAALITAAVTGQIDVETYGKSGTPSATLERIEEEMQA